MGGKMPGVSSSAAEVPRLERLLRDVCRLALEAIHGLDWLDQLSGAEREAVEKDARLARTQRPDEALRDDFDAAGLQVLAKILRGRLGPPVVSAAWDSNRDAAQVDLDRLHAHRGKGLHLVGPPTGQIADAEAAAIIKRLRVRLEAYRREIMDEAGDWWPYIESATSNVDAFCFVRPGAPRQVSLIEGDLVTIDVVGVNPAGPDEDLRFRIGFGGSAGGPRPPDSGWRPEGSFSFEVPRIRQLSASVSVGVGDDGQGEYAAFLIEVCPQREPVCGDGG